MKRTFIVQGGIAAAALRLEAARNSWHGTEIRSIDQVAARLAGGFLGVVDNDTLAEVARDVIRSASATDLGDLVGIADLPGLPSALAVTLNKAWRAGIDLGERAAGRPGITRLSTLARMEAAVLDRLPRTMLRPAELVRCAVARINHAAAVLGPVECRFLPDLAPCWRPLIIALAGRVEVTWNAGPRPVPTWVHGSGIPDRRDSRRHAGCACGHLCYGPARSD